VTIGVSSGHIVLTGYTVLQYFAKAGWYTIHEIPIAARNRTQEKRTL
jgi:hypothetical protein